MDVLSTKDKLKIKSEINSKFIVTSSDVPENLNPQVMVKIALLSEMNLILPLNTLKIQKKK